MALSLILTLKLTLTLILTLFCCFMFFFEHLPMIFKLASFVRFFHCSNTVLLPKIRTILHKILLHLSLYRCITDRFRVRVRARRFITVSLQELFVFPFVIGFRLYSRHRLWSIPVIKCRYFVNC